MTQDAWILLLGRIVLISGFFSAVAWIAVYSKLAAWWRGPIGRALVTAKAIVATLFALSILGSVFNLHGRWLEWVTVVLIGAMTPVLLWRIKVWLDLDRAGHLSRVGDGHPGDTPGQFPRVERTAPQEKVREREGDEYG